MSRASFAILCGAAAAFVLSRAWIADDAFITHRVVENLLAGHGLRWNADERVQVFTHPLWLLLLVPLRAGLGSLPAASLALSALCLGAAGALAWRAARAGRVVFLLAFVAPLLASRAFRDHAVSGLETPLTAACTAAFAALALRPDARLRPPWLGLAAAAALLATTRLDAALLVLPCLGALAWRARDRLDARALALGALPLVAWELFSLVYYGFALPNTKYAKLDAGIPLSALIRQGLFYALDLARRDAASVVLLALGLVLSARCALRARRGAEPGAAPAVAALGLGIAAHLAFVVGVGGDFMSGRFFAPAIFLAALIAAHELAGSLPASAALAVASAAAALLTLSPRSVDPNATWHGIADERRVFEHTTGFWSRPGLRDGAPERHPWWRDGASAAERARAGGEPVVIVRGAVGMLGLAAGPGVTVIDEFGLGDALLARLPAESPRRWRIGHFRRRLPEGYLRARQTGDAGAMHPDLARYWEDLRLATSGPLWAPDRLRALVRLHSGADDALLARYLAQRSAAPDPGLRPREAPGSIGRPGGGPS